MPTMTFTADVNKTVTISGQIEATITNGGRMQSISYNSQNYTEFPVNLTLTGEPSITAVGTPAPTITIDYTGTTEPEVTDTPAG